MSSEEASGGRPLKQRRITRACDACHRRGVKCVSKPAGGCASCDSYGEVCTYDRPVKRRGPRKGNAPAAASTSTSPTPSSSKQESPMPTTWHAPDAAHSKSIPMLLEFYKAIIYPFHPLFVWPPFLVRVAASEHLTNRAFCASLMSACALASSRLAQCGPLFFTSSLYAPVLPADETPDLFYQAAKDSIWLRPGKEFTVDELRATVLLNITCIQKGDFTEMRFWTGAFQTMDAVTNLHDEALWPPDLSLVDKEERKRLVHLAYQHSVYTAIVTGTPLVFRERQLHVPYPTEVDDEMLLGREGQQQEGVAKTPLPVGRNNESWMRGWNATCDLYRILEHAVDQLRNSQGAPNTITASLIAKTDTSAYSTLLTELYAALPPWARTFHNTTLDPSKHIFNFQVCNILITMQNARIISLCSNGFTTEEGVSVAKELMDSLTRVPHEYLLANSVPVFHQLAGIGHILGKYTTRTAPSSTLLGVRSIIEGMSALLTTLQPGLVGESATGKAHGMLVRYAKEVDLYLSVRVEAGEEAGGGKEEVRPVAVTVEGGAGAGAGAPAGVELAAGVGAGGGLGMWPTPGAPVGLGSGDNFAGVGLVEPFDPLPMPFDLFNFEGGHFDDLFPDLTLGGGWVGAT